MLVPWPQLASERPIRIHVQAGCGAASDYLSVSAGTASAETAGMTGYVDDARIPRLPWRPLDDGEREQFATSDAVQDPSRTVALVRLEGPEIEAVAPDEPIGNRALFAALRRVCTIGEPMKVLGQIRNVANLATTTLDPHRRKFLGLHVDDWDAMSLEHRDGAVNRVCVNIGEEDRYLLFLPLAIVDMARRMADEIGEAAVTPLTGTLLGRLFMTRHPEIPVVRLRVPARMAYIAPTENLVHDGSTVGQARADEQFTVLGHIALSA